MRGKHRDASMLMIKNHERGKDWTDAVQQMLVSSAVPGCKVHVVVEGDIVKVEAENLEIQERFGRSMADLQLQRQSLAPAKAAIKFKMVF